MSRVRLVAFTDVGLRRKRNEDAVLVAGWLCQTHEGAVVTMDFESTDPFVCVVADGMGGHAGGNTASRTALNVIAERSPGWRTVDDVSATISYANDQVRGVGAQTDLEGLGTTVAGLCVTTEAIIVFNVGDSRVYSITGGWPQQLSRDDAVLDAAGNPTNVITQSLGQPGPVQTHVTTLPLQAGTYLLCSDGVSGMLTEADLRAAFSGADLAQCAANVVAATRANGAEDNFSFVIVDVPGLDSPAPPQGPPVGRIH
ncbi:MULTISPECIES: PP2C family protein-serine/threonine phosphatase [unclassified Mycobacterium]|uniref:PP2C family protein-serine/threonine phosphatase n=1 Tax=unclassified Mycobacterium TaxID=2642494 RepID=UPI0029C8D768|nr:MULTISPECIES: protein phosphatase 2C domain-containing protein [unclassified Mycobacterium]